MKTTTKRVLFINAFVLKIIAILSVLSNHINFAFMRPQNVLYTPMIVFGRLAFPLFAFFIVQGIIHSRNRYKYLLRLAYLYIVLQVFALVAYFASGSSFANIFLTLASGAALLTYIHERRWKRVYLLIPIVIHLTLSIINIFVYHPVLFLFTGDYELYGTAVIIGFYLASIFANLYVRHQGTAYFNDEKALLGTLSAQFAFNIFSSISLFVVHGIWYIFGVFELTNAEPVLQHWALLLMFILPFYNGELGHNSKTWRIIYYLFFPVHLVIIALIVQLI